MTKKTKMRGGGLWDTITGAVGDATKKVQQAVGMDAAAETVQQAADSTGLTDATQMPGVASETPGTTTVGGPSIAGRRRRRTSKSKKIMKKTMRRKH